MEPPADPVQTAHWSLPVLSGLQLASHPMDGLLKLDQVQAETDSSHLKATEGFDVRLQRGERYQEKEILDLWLT